MDVVVTDDVWRWLAAAHPVRRRGGFASILVGRVQVLGHGSHFVDPAIEPVAAQIAFADVIAGRRYVSLEVLRRFKLSLGRPKDLRDVALIDAAASVPG